MLKTLRIRNLATIEDLRVDFGAGLNVLTGETGAGKSIVMDALGLAAGARGDAALVRAGADRAVVEAAFAVAPHAAIAALLTERGLDAGEGELIIRRELPAAGSGRVLVNGSPTTVSVLRDLGSVLVDLHGQHEHQGLLSPDLHLTLLDAFGGHAGAVAAVVSASREATEAASRLERLVALGRDGAVRADGLRAIVHEVHGVDPKAGELAALGRERAVLQNASRVSQLLATAIGRLDDGDQPAIGSVHAAERSIADLARIDPTLDALAARIRSARLEIEDARDTLTAYRDATDFDPARLDAIETRAAAIERLLLKWGPSEEDVLREAARVESELSTIENLDAQVEAGERDLAQAAASYDAGARALGAARRDAARRLAAAVDAELAPLALPKARFSVVLTDVKPGSRVAFPASGSERAEFHLAPNPGEASRPIARAASGGELSRLMLALHVVLEAAGGHRVLVFDEVDAGVSGRVASAVGARLKRLAARHQVLCVTHLPQVAACGDGHYHVAKRVASGRTHTEIVPLSHDARLDELARMLGGHAATAASRNNAAELLAEAGQAGRATRRS